MSSIGNIRARTIADDRPTLRTPVILEHVELDFQQITWLARIGDATTTLGRWDVREGHAN